MKKVYLFLLIAISPVNLICQQDRVFALHNEVSLRISVDTTINENTPLEPFASQMTISGLAFSGEFTLHSDSSLIRIVLMDQNYNEYLIYEAYPILSGSGQFSVDEWGEETSLLSNITPTRITVELVDASIYLKEFIINQEDTYQATTKSTLSLQQSKYKVDRINQNLQKTGQTWVAGETSISKLSYQEKKSMFGGKVPNFQGFEYYVGGVFVLPGAEGNVSDAKGTTSQTLSQQISPYPNEFSWKDRHGEDWVTPVKKQGACNSCFAFGASAAAELLVNLYFNRLLDYDLSEQNLVSCTIGSCNDGGYATETLDFMKNTGIVFEDCFSYTASDQACSEICDNPSERIKIADWERVYIEEDMKREIIKGAAAASILSWNHFAQFTGYKVLKEGDNLFISDEETDLNNISSITIEQNNPLIGQTAWLIKNSYGVDWGDNGYGYIVGDQITLYSLNGPVSSTIFNESDILCVDNDGDGYYSWGIGPKPSHCPQSPDQADGDDSDPCFGPMDEYGNLTYITSTPEAKDTTILYGNPADLYVNGANVQWYSDKKLLNLVYTGNLFTNGHTEIGIYTYYVTETLSGCESAANDISLSIVAEIPPPIGHDTIISEGQPAILTVEGEKGAVFNWYEDPLLTILLDSGESYETEKTDTGVYTYYVTQTLCLIESAPDTVLLKISNHIYIPDAAFLHALIEEGVDADGDSLIHRTEAEAVESLYVNYRGITDMTGIEAFVNIDTLYCQGNRLTNLDVSNNTALESLGCRSNQLTNLDVSNNSALRELYCSGNQLTGLDVSNNTALEELSCSGNQLTGLDVSNNTALEELSCYKNQLTSLDVSNCIPLTHLDCNENPLTSLDVSKNSALTHLDCSENPLTSLDVSSCTALAVLDCAGCKPRKAGCFGLTLTTLDISNNPALEALYCSNQLLTNLDVSNCPALTDLNCWSNQLTSLDVTNNSSLTGLNCRGNKLTSLDVSNNTALESLNINNMSLERVCVWELPFPPSGIEVIWSGYSAHFSTVCGVNKVSIPDTAFLNALIDKGVDTNEDSLISYTEAEALNYLDLSAAWEDRGRITDMTGIEAFINLDTLICFSNQLTSLNVSNNTALTSLDCSDNQLTSLDVSNNTALTTLNCSINNLTSLDISNNHNLTTIGLESLQDLHEVCVWTMPFPPEDVKINIGNSPNVDFSIECGYNIHVFIPDTAFLHALIEEEVDTNGDSLIHRTEAEAVNSLDVRGRWGNPREISDLTGIESFVNLETLDCSNNQLTSLDVSKNTALTTLDCNYNYNQLATLDVSGCNALESLSCIYNQLTSLDVSNNTALTTLDCSYNQLATLDVSNSTALERLSCYKNQLTSLDVSDNSALRSLSCFDNQLTSLDVSNNVALEDLGCSNNQLTSLDLANNTELAWLDCFDNQLTSLDVSSCIILAHLDCSQNQITSLDMSKNAGFCCLDSWNKILNLSIMPSLQQVCVWESFPAALSSFVDTTGSPNIYFTKECTTGIKEGKTSELSIYPNPTNNFLTIESDNPDHYSIEITTQNGQLISRENMDGTTHQLDLSSFQKGVYFITVRSKDFVTTRKIIKY